MSRLARLDPARAAGTADWSAAGDRPGSTTGTPAWARATGDHRHRTGGPRPAAADLCGVLAEVAGALRSGAAPEVAWEHAGVRVSDGLPEEAGLRELGADDRQVGAVRAACAVSMELGAAPGPVLDRVVAALEDDARVATQRAAAFAGPRATTRLLTWLPGVGLVLGVALGTDPWRVLLDGGAGTLMLAAGIGLSVAGRRWSGRLLDAAAQDDPRSPEPRPGRGAPSAVHRG